MKKIYKNTIAGLERNNGNNFLPLLGEVRKGINLRQYPPQPSLIREGGATHVGMSDNISDNATNIVECATHVDIFDNVSKCAFTLAEILIALGVIGVVAALTLPPVIRHYNDKATVTKLKKIYSTFSQAHEFLKNDDEYAPENWDLNNWTTSAENMLGYYMKYVKNLKICNRQTGCFPKDIIYKNLNGVDTSPIDNRLHFAKAILSDGTLMYSWVAANKCVDETRCGVLLFDINGHRGPNQFGVDTFEFDVYAKGIYPQSGDPSDTNRSTARCNRKASNDGNGRGCTKWVLMYENLDYRYCDGLSFNGKHSCKDK